MHCAVSTSLKHATYHKNYTYIKMLLFLNTETIFFFVYLWLNIRINYYLSRRLIFLDCNCLSIKRKRNFLRCSYMCNEENRDKCVNKCRNDMLHQFLNLLEMIAIKIGMAFCFVFCLWGELFVDFCQGTTQYFWKPSLWHLPESCIPCQDELYSLK